MKTIHKINTLLLFLLVMVLLLAMGPKPAEGASAAMDTTIRLQEVYEVENTFGTWVDTDSGSYFIPDVPVIDRIDTLAN